MTKTGSTDGEGTPSLTMLSCEHVCGSGVRAFGGNSMHFCDSVSRGSKKKKAPNTEDEVKGRGQQTKRDRTGEGAL